MSSPSSIAYFGYGSLVNLATLRTDYLSAHAASLSGWQRVWLARPAQARSFGLRENIAFLSVEPSSGTTINGMVIVDALSNLPELDRREELYDRHELGEGAFQLTKDTQLPVVGNRYLYVARPDQTAAQQPGEPQILRSYLDAVLQGFYRQWGEEGIAGFHRTTRNCHFPILEDRAAPIYPRAVDLLADERAAIAHYFPPRES